jgi:hypothetical protein
VICKQTFNYSENSAQVKRQKVKGKTAFILPFTFCLLPLFYKCAVKDLQTLQAPFPGKKGILPELPRAFDMESGILGERRLPGGDDSTDFYASFFLADLLFRDFLSLNGHSLDGQTVMHENSKMKR